MQGSTVMELLVTAVLRGGIYSLVAVGLALVFGVMNVPSFAHGSSTCWVRMCPNQVEGSRKLGMTIWERLAMLELVGYCVWTFTSEKAPRIDWEAGQAAGGKGSVSPYRERACTGCRVAGIWSGYLGEAELAEADRGLDQLGVKVLIDAGSNPFAGFVRQH